ncbi:PQQ-dependent sugar dehydrogenase, partial [bacterium]|nr:PQQ-dependent sugar dehydrogenase [bacterium]
IAEYSVSDFSPNVAQSSETRLLSFSQPQSNHNGGQLAFGPDGMLYIASGDGGGANDQHGSIGNGQNLNTLLGKILCIDVNDPGTYQAPNDNPFVGIDGMDEIWAYGLRNPWRFSFDRATGRLFCADVGQNKIEEVNIIERGGNYGWRLMEGSECFNPSNCDPTGLILPITEYNHAANRYSVTGGYVYHGREFSSMIGQYIFADYGGDFFALEETAPNNWLLKEVSWELDSGATPSIAVTSFVEGEDGELYVLYAVGDVFSQPGRLARVTVPGDEPASANDWQLYHSINEEEI